MPSLTVWRYPTPLGVDAGELHLKRLEEQGALTVQDAVAVIWMPGADEPAVRRLRHRTAGGAGRGTFWGALVGTLVLAPVAGAAVGATAGAGVERLRHGGVPDDTIEALRGVLVRGTSALFVVTSDATRRSSGRRSRPTRARWSTPRWTTRPRRISGICSSRDHFGIWT